MTTVTMDSKMITAIETYGLRTPKQKKAFGKIQSDINESVKATMAKTKRLPWDSGVSPTKTDHW